MPLHWVSASRLQRCRNYSAYQCRTPRSNPTVGLTGIDALESLRIRRPSIDAFGVSNTAYLGRFAIRLFQDRQAWRIAAISLQQSLDRKRTNEMQSIRVAAISVNSPLGQVDQVLEDTIDWCRQAADAGAELAVFPELHIHGHCTPNTWELAEAVPDGPSVQRLLAMAKQFNLFLSVGLSEKENNLVYNTQVIVGPEGYIGKQRKLHLSRDEVLFYKGGRELPVFDIGKCKLGSIICYDNQFPELARILALRGADVLLMPHAARVKMWDDTPESMAGARNDTHDYFISCYAMRARENACFAILTNCGVPF